MLLGVASHSDTEQIPALLETSYGLHQLSGVPVASLAGHEPPLSCHAVPAQSHDVLHPEETQVAELVLHVRCGIASADDMGHDIDFVGRHEGRTYSHLAHLVAHYVPCQRAVGFLPVLILVPVAGDVDVPRREFHERAHRLD